MRLCGVYKIISLTTKRYYIGSSCNIKQRWYRHLYDLRNNKHNNVILQRTYNKYGKKDLSFEVIESCPTDRNVLIEREQYYINNRTEKCINLSTIAGSIEMTLETREKISKKAKQRLQDKTKHPMYGKHHTHQTKEKLSKAHKGKRKHTEQFKEKQRQQLLGKPRRGRSYRGKANPNFGKTHTTETRKKISQNKPPCDGVNNPSYDSTIYTFTRKDGYNFIGTRFDFIHQHNVQPSGVCWLIKRKLQTHKGWSIHNHE